MDAPHVAYGKAVCCPACGGIFTPVLPRAELVDLGTGAEPVESLPDAAILGPIDPAPAEPAPPGEPAPQAFGPQSPVPYVPVVQIPPPEPAAPVPPPELSSLNAALAISDVLNLPPSDGEEGAADALALLAGGRTVQAPAGPTPPDRQAPPKPDGWYIETDNGEIGPFTSRQIAIKAYRDEIGREAMLSHPGKGVRIVAGKVPFLFRRPGDGLGASSSDPAAADDGEPGWYVEMLGKEIGPLTTAQVEHAARRGIIARDAILTHARKGIRVVAGDVPRLFPEDRPAGATAPPTTEDAPPPPTVDVQAPPSPPTLPSPLAELGEQTASPGEAPAADALAALQQALAAAEARKAEAEQKKSGK